MSSRRIYITAISSRAVDTAIETLLSPDRRRKEVLAKTRDQDPENDQTEQEHKNNSI